jgi:hypothetical protein
MALNLGKQIGPLPAGAWLGVVGGGLVLAYFINKRQSAGSGDEVPALSDPDSDVGVGGGQFQYEPIQTVTPDVDTPPDDNNGWGIKAKNYLIGQGFAPNVAINVVEKFLAGMQLAANEKLIIDVALLKLGSPPEPIAPTDDVPTAPPTTPSTPGTSKPMGRPVVRATPVRRGVRFTWTYAGGPIAGFSVSVVDLSTKKKVVSRPEVSKATKSLTWTAPASWTHKYRHKVQITVVPFTGGFGRTHKYGPGASASATPTI